MSASPASLEALLIQQSQAQILAAFLAIAQAIGLPTTTWQPGDPTRSLGMLESELLSTLESIVVGYIQSGFLDYAAIPNADGSTNPWLPILAQQVFGVQVPAAQYATTTETLTNSQGGQFTFEPGDLTFTLSSAPGVTYTNTTGCTLTGVGSPGATATVTVIATQAGTAFSAGEGEIDTLVTTFEGISCTNSTAAIGVDSPSPATIVSLCRTKLASLSPNGPSDAYRYVATNSALTGAPDVTKASVYSYADTGVVNIVIAGASGAVSSTDVALVQTAIQTYASPLCITPTVSSAVNTVVNITYSLWAYANSGQSDAQIQASVQAALEQMIAARPIGGDVLPGSNNGFLFLALIESTIAGVLPPGQIFDFEVSVPSADLALANNAVPVLGTVTGTVTLVPLR